MSSSETDRPRRAYVPLSAYRVPETPAREAARIWSRLRARIRDRLEAWRGDPEEEVERRRPAGSVLDEVTPEPDWRTEIAGLAEALGDWPDDDAVGPPVRAVIGAAGSGAAPAIEALAQDRGWPVLEPPEPAELLAEIGERPLLDGERLPEPGTPIVIPRLEGFSLRIEPALRPLREMLRQLNSGEHPVLVACNSWTWAYLRTACGIEELFGEPLAPAPLDGEALAAVLEPRVRASGREIRSLRRGEPLFDADRQAPPPEMGHLAWLARGIPGVALALWRLSLEQSEADGDGVLWLDDRAGELIPPLGPAAEAPHRFVLHALLLHPRLDAATLDRLLPFARHRVGRALESLAGAGLVAETDGRFAVAPAAYGEVRRLLKAEGFEVDDL